MGDQTLLEKMEGVQLDPLPGGMQEVVLLIAAFGEDLNNTCERLGLDYHAAAHSAGPDRFQLLIRIGPGTKKETEDG